MQLGPFYTILLRSLKLGNFSRHPVKIGPKPVIPPALEEKLLECLLLIERKYFGCTPDDVRSPAFQLAVHNKISSPFPIAKEAAGKDWLKRCMKRHSDKLMLCQLTETATARAT